MQKRSPTIAAVILAAGRSGRMGQCKALLDIGGKTALELIRENLHIAGIERQVIITGHHAAEINQAAPTANCIYNPDYANGGMISSVKVGINALKGKCDGIIIALVDHPMVAAPTMERIITAWIFAPNKIVRPRYDGKMGHPVVISETCASSILSLPANATLKTWMTDRADQVEIADVNDPGIAMDLDTPEEYATATARLGSR